MLPLFFCSCSSTQTEVLEEALESIEDSIKFTDRLAMEKRPMFIPALDVTSYKKGGKLNFLIAFDRDINKNLFSQEEWDEIKTEFGNALIGSCRYPKTTNRYNFDPKQLNLETLSSGYTTSGFDASKFNLPDGVLKIKPFLKSKNNSTSFNLTCTPLDANAKYPMKYFPEFTVKVFDVNNKSSKESSNEEKLYTKKFSRVAIVKFFMEMYKNFPLTGEIKGFEENIATVRASRAEGLQPNMEVFICAFKKSEGANAMIVPLYNATVENLSLRGNSTLKIWRMSNKPSAQRIINLIEDDFDDAKEIYEIFAVADSFAQWPDFVKKPRAK
jgi:hypothetical protein